MVLGRLSSLREDDALILLVRFWDHYTTVEGLASHNPKTASMSSHVRGATLFRLAIRHTQFSTYAVGLCSSSVVIGGYTGGLTLGPNSVYFIDVYLLNLFLFHLVYSSFMTTASTRPPWRRHHRNSYYQSRRNIGKALQIQSSAKRHRIALISKRGVSLNIWSTALQHLDHTDLCRIEKEARQARTHHASKVVSATAKRSC
jgi:hypothetical protein